MIDMKLKAILAFLFFSFLLSQSASALNINTCQNLNTANTVYNLTANVSSGATCFTILANNITLDGNRYTVNYSYSNTGYAIDDSGGYDNITIKNLKTIQGGSGFMSSFAVYGIGMSNSTIANNSFAATYDFTYVINIQASSNSNKIADNNISSTGNFANDIYLSSSNSNIISNNILVSSGDTESLAIYLSSSYSNNITGGSIISKLSYDYNLDNVGGNNSFVNTNFTAQRKIFLNNAASWFNYNNQTSGNIWLKTSESGGIFINRILVTWSQTNMKWNDTPELSLTTRYNITGLQASTQYIVTNSSSSGTTSQTLTTDSSGNLPSFTIALNGNTEIKAEATNNIGSCRALDTANTVYNLTANVSTGTTCFTIGANNVTINGNGYWINYSTSSAGYAIDDSGDYDNITIKNLNIVQGSTSVNSYAIYGSGMGNSTIANNSITTSGSYGYGIYLASSGTNTFSNNNITTSGSDGYGIILSSSNSNTISNNNITTSNTWGYGIYLHSSSTNTFSNNKITTSGDTGFGIYLSTSSNSNNIMNNNITTSNTGSYGIYLFSSSNSNTLSNNNITASGSGGHGIYLSSSSTNTLSNNIITTLDSGNGIYLSSSSTNNITGGSIVSKTGFDYYLSNIDIINNFTSTNFTVQRSIYFLDTSSWFNYNNQTSGNIWLKTSVSAASSINRTLASWNNALMKWNDTNSTKGLTTSYNITGLLANMQYTITNSSKTGTTSQTLTTDSSGNLPSFTIFLNGNTEVKAWFLPPQWSANATSPKSPQIYNIANNYSFQINWAGGTSAFANATFQLGRPNGTLANYTKCGTAPCTNNDSAAGASVWYINFTQDQFGPVGTYNFTWFGTDITGNQNMSDTMNYKIINLTTSVTINLALHLGAAVTDDSIQATSKDICISDANGWFGLTAENPNQAQSGNLSADYNINITATNSDKFYLAVSRGSCNNFRNHAADAQLGRFLSPLMSFSYAKTNLIQLILQFNSTDIISNAHWGKGSYLLSIANQGYNATSGKQKLDINIVK